MKSIYFSKMSGAGNDFIVIDKKENPGIVLSQNAVTRLCDRRNGIGADGVIIIDKSDKLDFDMNYYNADGSYGSLCGNGARCAIRFAEMSGKLKGHSARFSANSGFYSGEVLNSGRIRFDLNEPAEIRPAITIEASGQKLKASFADTGSPHVVLSIGDLKINPGADQTVFDNLADVPVTKIGREIRYSKDFMPGGTNVNFIHIVDDKINIRTYERGVEDETPACGTGAAAAALIANIKYNLSSPVALLPKSGEALTVSFEKNNNKFTNISLTGPAEIIFTGTIEI